jgi:hypothetical protein
MIHRYASLEATTVLVMILCYIWWWRPVHPLSWIGILGFVLASQAYRRETPVRLGFRLTNLKNALTTCAPAVLLLGLALVVGGIVGGTTRKVTPESAFLSLGFYCLWGLFQQYLLNGYFLNRFAETSPAAAPMIAALSFSAIHAPNWFLMIVTLLGGFASAKVYLKFRSLYVLGLAHGILGFLLYLCVPDSVSHHLYVGPKWFS